MQRKSVSPNIQFKADQPGAFTARIATLNVVDKDGDVTLAGAFPVGKEIVISAYMHTSWGGALPVGKGIIGANDNEAWVDGQFFMDTNQGLETYKVVKALGNLGEWSYGYDPKDYSTDASALAPYPGAARILKLLDVYESSPVLRGAGVDTATLSIKSAAKARSLTSRLKQLQLDPNTLATVAQIDLLADELDELVDTLMDQFGIPDPDEIAEGEPEEPAVPAVDPNASGADPNAPEMPKNLAYDEHAKTALAGVQAFVTRSKSLADLRAKKQRKEGRVLSSTNRERLAALLRGLNDAATDISKLLDETNSDAGKAADNELAAIWLENVRRLSELTAA